MSGCQYIMFFLSRFCTIRRKFIKTSNKKGKWKEKVISFSESFSPNCKVRRSWSAFLPLENELMTLVLYVSPLYGGHQRIRKKILYFFLCLKLSRLIQIPQLLFRFSNILQINVIGFLFLTRFKKACCSSDLLFVIWLSV